MFKRLALLALFLTVAHPATAESISVAVAANFTATAEKLAKAFEQESGDQMVLSFGASGALYAQIVQGAPFQVFLAADQKVPQRAMAEGWAVPDSAFTYALGRLALYSTSLDLTDGGDVLAQGNFRHLALADPSIAPYGAAALETLRSLGLEARVAGRIVMGENVSQALQFVESGNAELGFVALSQARGNEAASVWIVPAELYAPIRQDAVLLKQGEASAAAADFLAFLKGPKASAIIEQDGYGIASRP